MTEGQTIIIIVEAFLFGCLFYFLSRKGNNTEDCSEEVKIECNVEKNKIKEAVSVEDNTAKCSCGAPVWGNAPRRGYDDTCIDCYHQRTIRS